MSFAFQSNDCIKEALYEELQNVLNPIAEIRMAAEKRIKHLEFTEGYGVYLAECIMNQSFDLGIRQLASVMLKQYVENHWRVVKDGETNLEATEQVKKIIKNILPNGLYDANSKIRCAVAYTISTIASWDWPNNWGELFDIIVKCLAGNEDSVHGAMQVLVEFTYDIQHEIVDVGPIILFEVYRIFEAESVYSVKTRSCAVEIFKALLKTITMHIQTKEEQANILNPVLPNFIEKLIHGLSVPNGSTSDYELKTEILKVLVYIISDMPKCIAEHMPRILPPVWQLLTQCADTYVRTIANESSANFDDDEDEEHLNFKSMIGQLFEFLNAISESRKYKSSLKNVLTDIIYLMIVYMQLQDNQIEEMAEDAEKFIEHDDENMDSTIRAWAQQLLMAIKDDMENSILPALSDALSRHVAVAEAEKAAGNRNWWKIHESSMFAVGSFKDLILQKPEKFHLSQYLYLVRNLMVYDTSPFLLGRCLYTLSRFTSSDLYNDEMLIELLDVTEKSISPETPISLRIMAFRSIYEFCLNLKKAPAEKHSIIIPKLGKYFEGILALVGQSKSAFLGLLLETLEMMVSFDQQFTATLKNRAIPLTIAVMLKYHDDHIILELVQDLLKVFSQNPYCLQTLQEKMIPTLVSIFNLSDDESSSDMQDIAMDVLQTIVTYSEPPLSDNLIEIAFPAAIHCILRTNNYSVMQNGGECLRAFITVSPDQICNYKNGEGINYIMQVTALLLNPMINEYTARFIGRLVVTIITKIGNRLGENIDLLLKAVISKMQLVESLNVNMSLIMTFAHLFLTQMDAVLNFLSTVPGPTGEPALSYVFANWLSRQNNFYGCYEKKVSIMALCKLFEYGVTSKDTRLTSIVIKDSVILNSETCRTRSQTAANETWVNIPILVKMFKLLINELETLKNMKLAEEEVDNEWTDDDSDNSFHSQEEQELKVSDLYIDEEDDDLSENDLFREIMQDPIFQISMEETLIKFLQNFIRDENFGSFVEHLTDNEKKILQSIQTV